MKMKTPSTLRLFERWEEAAFVSRPNRFTLLLEKNGEQIRAYIPNTGRLEEYTVGGACFFVVPYRTKLFSYRAVAALYRGDIVFLDTITMNTVAEHLIQHGCFPGIGDQFRIRREKTMGKIRPDFFLAKNGLPPLLLEIKTCTLCHKGTALFPDAPSKRAVHHIKEFGTFTARGYATLMAFMVPNNSAIKFMPNIHTDAGFSEAFLINREIEFRALRVRFEDPVTVDLSSAQEIEIDYVRAAQNFTRSGAYALILRNKRQKNIEIGRLGKIHFDEGYYVYIGSALGSLDARIRRHTLKRKKQFWHIDYISPSVMELERTLPIRRKDRIESDLAKRVSRLCDRNVKGFGSSDSTESSHLFYFRDPPHRNGRFMEIILDFKTFSE
jgi:sugar fermentation stimulation protein A